MLIQRKRNQAVYTLLLLLAFLFAFQIHANSEAPSSVKKNKQQKLLALRKKIQKLLLTRLKNQNGDWMKISVLPPIDYTQLDSTDFMINLVGDTFRGYDPSINVGDTSHRIKSVSLEQIRYAMALTQSEMLVLSVIFPANVDVYIYDRRNPYQIYGQSEGFVEGPQEKLDSKMAEHYSKIAFRRVLFKYLSNQAYDLPRDNAAPVLKTELPRSIASYEIVEAMNREVNSNFYGSLGWGAALSRGETNSFWNSSLISGNLGIRLWGDLFVEGAVDLSAYNLASGSLKYMIFDREDSIRFMFGLGGALGMARHTISWDPLDDIKGTQQYVVPSASILLPVSDVYFKVEAKMFWGMTSSAQIFSIAPSIHLFF